MIGAEINPGCYAVHRVGMDGRLLHHLVIVVCAPAYWRVDFVPRHGWREAGRDRDGRAPRSWGMERECAAWSSAAVQPANHVAIYRIRSQSPRKEDRTAR
jgi:hypothetical protein